MPQTFTLGMPIELDTPQFLLSLAFRKKKICKKFSRYVDKVLSASVAVCA